MLALAARSTTALAPCPTTFIAKIRSWPALAVSPFKPPAKMPKMCKAVAILPKGTRALARVETAKTSVIPFQPIRQIHWIPSHDMLPIGIELQEGETLEKLQEVMNFAIDSGCNLFRFAPGSLFGHKNWLIELMSQIKETQGSKVTVTASTMQFGSLRKYPPVSNPTNHSIQLIGDRLLLNETRPQRMVLNNMDLNHPGRIEVLAEQMVRTNRAVKFTLVFSK